MSGDMFGVAAALKLDQDLHVLVVYDANDKNQANAMLELYHASVQPIPPLPPHPHQANNPIRVGKVSGAPASLPHHRSSLVHKSSRIAALQVANSRDFYKSLHGTPSNENSKRTVYSQFPKFPGRPPIRAMGASTKIVVDNFRTVTEKVARHNIVETWRIDDFDELGIARFLSRNGISGSGNYLFLWVRLSGRSGGAHLELDSGPEAWQQVINALPSSIIPVLIGDSFENELKPGGSHKLINLKKFWKQIPFCLYDHSKFTGSEARRAQFALFEYLVRANYKVCHLGMRSGVLESAALMGASVIYMEDTDNKQEKRIAELAASMLKYERLQLKELPTAEGRVINRNSQGWNRLYSNRITGIAKHCAESDKEIRTRISRLEKSVMVGSSFEQYETKFIELSLTAWKGKYQGVENWPAYKKANRHWCEALSKLMRGLYDATWSTDGQSKTFVDSDLKNIIDAIKKSFPREAA